MNEIKNVYKSISFDPAEKIMLFFLFKHYAWKKLIQPRMKFAEITIVKQKKLNRQEKMYCRFLCNVKSSVERNHDKTDGSIFIAVFAIFLTLVGATYINYFYSIGIQASIVNEATKNVDYIDNTLDGILYNYSNTERIVEIESLNDLWERERYNYLYKEKIPNDTIERLREYIKKYYNSSIDGDNIEYLSLKESLLKLTLYGMDNQMNESIDELNDSFMKILIMIIVCIGIGNILLQFISQRFSRIYDAQISLIDYQLEILKK